ncbi:hypothetical protein FBUS_00729 [Fasciolopsis buskii]|uniref:Uncharacterized protein n=1 Tax=Fasciolopsis buskii TaxID=27845 RepID=A0A8E0RL59_9TREM|nr:hypothetical protein FBUS_00729 [Fasciolopsis buski]
MTFLGFQTDKFPPLLLKPFKTTKDIRYSQFVIPAATLIERLSFSLVIDKLCLPENLTTIFRPRALPLVAPFGLKAPPSTLVLSDFFTVDVNLRNEPAVEIAGTFSSGYLHAWTSKNGQFASLDITLTCPSPGIWFIGSLFTDSSFSKDCRLLMFAQTTHEMVLDSQSTLEFHKSSERFSTALDQSTHSGYLLPTDETTGFSSTPKLSDSRSSWPSEYHNLRPSDAKLSNQQGWSPRYSHRRFSHDSSGDESTFTGSAKLSLTSSTTGSVWLSPTSPTTLRGTVHSHPSIRPKLIAHFHPLGGRLFE